MNGKPRVSRHQTAASDEGWDDHHLARSMEVGDFAFLEAASAVVKTAVKRLILAPLVVSIDEAVEHRCRFRVGTFQTCRDSPADCVEKLEKRGAPKISQM